MILNQISGDLRTPNDLSITVPIVVPVAKR